MPERINKLYDNTVKMDWIKVYLVVYVGSGISTTIVLAVMLEGNSA